MVANRMLPPDVFTALWRREIEEQWDALREFVFRERERVHDDSLWVRFQILAAMIRVTERVQKANDATAAAMTV
jgi:hypothetical protein